MLSLVDVLITEAQLNLPLPKRGSKGAWLGQYTMGGRHVLCNTMTSLLRLSSLTSLHLLSFLKEENPTESSIYGDFLLQAWRLLQLYSSKFKSLLDTFSLGRGAYCDHFLYDFIQMPPCWMDSVTAESDCCALQNSVSTPMSPFRWFIILPTVVLCWWGVLYGILALVGVKQFRWTVAI
jgi:hypothetical protein